MGLSHIRCSIPGPSSLFSSSPTSSSSQSHFLTQDFMWAPIVCLSIYMWAPTVVICISIERRQNFYVSTNGNSMWGPKVFCSLPSPAGSLVGSVCHLRWILSTDRRKQVILWYCHIIILSYCHTVILVIFSYWSYQKYIRTHSHDWH